MTKSKKRSTFDFGMEQKKKNNIGIFPNASRSMLYIGIVAVAFRSEEEVSRRGPP